MLKDEMIDFLNSLDAGQWELYSAQGGDRMIVVGPFIDQEERDRLMEPVKNAFTRLVWKWRKNDA